jgi:2-C-methyl-D-erythritol 2,4-cyclodiphosphate synthase
VAAPVIGLGIDVHRLGSTPPMWLAGLKWAEEPGLEGHSDADVVCHAVADAMLTAAGLGDLGTVFGTSDPAWAGASGLAILTETARRVHEAGWRVGSVSVQLVGNRPRIAPRRAEAERVMSAVVTGTVRLSATTTDGLGLTGRGEGVAAIATCLLLPR